MTGLGVPEIAPGGGEMEVTHPTHPSHPEPVSAGQTGCDNQNEELVNIHPVTPPVTPFETDDLQGISDEFNRTRIISTREKVVGAWLDATAEDTTRAAYRRDWDQFSDWCEARGVDALAASRQDVDRYRQRLLRHHARSTVARKLSTLSSFYRYGTLEYPDIVTDNPALRVRRPRVARESNRSGLDLEEARAVLALARAEGGRDAAVMLLLAWTGIRVMELRNASVTDLSVERGQRMLTVTRKGGKKQTLMIAPEAAAALDAYLDGRASGPLIMGARGGAVSRYEVAAIVDRYVTRASIVKRITPHSMRHTFATLALDAGADIREVQRMMGHASVDTTMRYDRARDRVDRSPAHALRGVL